jgi:hypothetical protein
MSRTARCRNGASTGGSARLAAWRRAELIESTGQGEQFVARLGEVSRGDLAFGHDHEVHPGGEIRPGPPEDLTNEPLDAVPVMGLADFATDRDAQAWTPTAVGAGVHDEMGRSQPPPDTLRLEVLAPLAEAETLRKRLDGRFHAALLLVGADGDALTAFGAAALEDGLALLRGHPGAESVRAQAGGAVGLVCTLHVGIILVERWAPHGAGAKKRATETQVDPRVNVITDGRTDEPNSSVNHGRARRSLRQYSKDHEEVSEMPPEFRFREKVLPVPETGC